MLTASVVHVCLKGRARGKRPRYIFSLAPTIEGLPGHARTSVLWWQVALEAYRGRQDMFFVSAQLPSDLPRLDLAWDQTGYWGAPQSRHVGMYVPRNLRQRLVGRFAPADFVKGKPKALANHPGDCRPEGLVRDEVGTACLPTIPSTTGNGGKAQS